MTEAGTYYAVSTAQEADLTKKSKKQKETIIVEAVKEVSQPHEDLMARIAEAPLDDTVSALRELTNAGPGKAVAYLKYELSKCPRCDNHHITVTLGNLKVDRQRNTQELAKLSKISSRDPHESGAQSRM
jgi:hypothetical protein